MMMILKPTKTKYKLSLIATCRHLILFGLIINKNPINISLDRLELQRTQIFKETSMETMSRRWPRENQQLKGNDQVFKNKTRSIKTVDSILLVQMSSKFKQARQEES